MNAHAMFLLSPSCRHLVNAAYAARLETAFLADYTAVQRPHMHFCPCLQFAVYAAYAARLETAFLADETASAKAVLTSAPPSPSPPSHSPSKADTSEPAPTQLQVRQLSCNPDSLLYPPCS